MNKTRITFLEAQLKTLTSKHQNDISALHAATESLLEKVRAEKEKERQELMDQFKAERDHAASLLSQEQQRVAELESRLEFDLFALRVESAQIVAEEREKTVEKIAELESRFAQERAGWQQGGQGGQSEAPAADHGPELARLREELQAAQALTAAQGAAHEQVAAQWEDDVQNYRKRILAVLNEKTALAAKLREAESALRVAVGSAVSTAA